MFGSSSFATLPFSTSSAVAAVSPPSVPQTVPITLKWVLTSRGNRWALDYQTYKWVLTNKNIQWVLDSRVSKWTRNPQTMKWTIK